MKTFLTTAITASLLATVAPAGSLSDVGLADPVIAGDREREVTDDCRVPIRSERTGEILYWNWADPSCWEPHEDGDDGFDRPDRPQSPGCEYDCGPKGPKGDKPKNPNKGGGNGPEGGDPGNNPDNGNDDES